MDFESFKQELEQKILPSLNKLGAGDRNSVRKQILYASDEKELKEKLSTISSAYGIIIDINSFSYFNKPNLQKVYDVYSKWLKVSDTKRIDIILATYLTKDVAGTKVWIFIIGNSGDWKSEQLNALDFDDDTRVITNFTSKTLVSGNPKVDDLAEELRDKVVLIPELAQILSSHPTERGAIWSQLRDLYDGIAGKQSGTGKRAKYTGLNVTLIAGGTPKFDHHMLQHAELGTRELIWRTNQEDILDDEEIMDKVWKNEEEEQIMRKEIKNVTKKFLEHKGYKVTEINEETFKKIKNKVTKLRYLRATALTDNYTGEIINDAQIEKPTRLLKQFKRIFLGLKSLDDNYSDERALDVLDWLVISSGNPVRSKVLHFFIINYEDNKTNGYSEYEISKSIRLGRKSTLRELNILWNMKVINKKKRDNYDSEGRNWKLNLNHPLIQILQEEYNK